MGTQYDADTTDGVVTLQDTESVELEVATDVKGGEVVCFIDNGTTASSPQEYTLGVTVEDVEGDSERLFHEEGEASSGSTSRSWEDKAIPDRMHYTLTNVSGGAQDYRMRVTVFR